jgi:hypothetical protein
MEQSRVGDIERPPTHNLQVWVPFFGLNLQTSKFLWITNMCLGLSNLETNPQIKQELISTQHPTTLLNTWKGSTNFTLSPLILQASSWIQVVSWRMRSCQLWKCIFIGMHKGHLEKTLNVMYIESSFLSTSSTSVALCNQHYYLATLCEKR